MIKEIKFTDNAIKQINHLLSTKDDRFFLESQSKEVAVLAFNMISLLTKKLIKMI